jgi:hypothetical protein
MQPNQNEKLLEIIFELLQIYNNNYQMHQDLTSNENHINTNKLTENTIESKLDISGETIKQIDDSITYMLTQVIETITSSVKIRGGRRSGSSSKLGHTKSQETKDKIRQAMIGKQNAKKHRNILSQNETE